MTEGRKERLGSLLDRAYQRYRYRYVVFQFGWVLLAAMIGTAITVVLLLRSIRHSGSDLLILLGLSEPAVVIGMLVAYRRTFRRGRAAIDWLKVAPSASGAVAAWRFMGTFIPETGSYAVRWIAALLLPAVLYSIPLLNLSASEVPAELLGVGFGFAVTYAYCMLTSQALLRPAISDAARFVPGDSMPTRRTISVRTRMIGAMAITTVFSAIVASSVGSIGRLGAQRVLGALAVSLAVGVGFTALLILSIIATFADPVRALVAGTDRVRNGNLAEPVPVTTFDEFGLLAHSFNEMIDGLGEREQLRTLTDDLNVALEAAVADARAARSRIVVASDAQRRSLERDLHDGAQQALVVLRLKLGQLAQLADRDAEAAQKLVRDLQAETDAALEQLRDLGHGLYPEALRSDGLAEALTDCARRASITTRVDCAGVGRLDHDVEVAVYFCCAEAVTNASKHAGSDATASIRVTADGGMLRFSVSDDGEGFVGSPREGTGGLQNMHDRISSLGGELSIRSTPTEGTTVTGAVPLVRAQEVAGPAENAGALI